MLNIKGTIVTVATMAVVAGAAIASPTPALALAPHVGLQKFQAYNYPDSYGRVQHWDKIGSKYVYGNWAARGSWSNQSSCWTGVTAYSYNFTS